MLYEVQRLQEFTLEMIGQGSVIIPAGWIGHATVLIVEFAGIDTESNPLFNLMSLILEMDFNIIIFARILKAFPLTWRGFGSNSKYSKEKYSLQIRLGSFTV